MSRTKPAEAQMMIAAVKQMESEPTHAGRSIRMDPWVKTTIGVRLARGRRAPIGAWLDRLEVRAPKERVVLAMANKLAGIFDRELERILRFRWNVLS